MLNRYESKTSKKIVSTDTYDFIVKIWVDMDTIMKGKQVVKFLAEDEGIKHINFYFIDYEGLETYAHINGGLVVFANDGIASSDHLQMTDWISDKGLIKRTGVF